MSPENLENLEAERAVIGAVLLNPDRAKDAILVLTSGDFVHPLHRRCWTAIQSLRRAGTPIDVLVVADAAGMTGVELTELGAMVSATPHSENAMHYAGIVARKAAERRAMEISSELARRIGDEADDAEALTRRAAHELANLPFSQGNVCRDLAAVLEETMQQIEADHVERKAPGMPTGIEQLDGVTGGLRPEQLVILAARPSLGKTALGLQVGAHVAAAGMPVFIASLEMSAPELVERLVAHLGQVDYERLRSRRMNLRDWEDARLAERKIAALPMAIDDRSMTLGAIVSTVRSWRARDGRGGPALVIVDYIQLVRDPGAERREQEVAEVSRSLKLLAKELKVTVIAMSQLNRLSETQDREPRLSDLRESGAIEQDADTVIFVHRDIRETEADAKLIVGKNRGGRVGAIDTHWKGSVQTFFNLAPPLGPYREMPQ